ncbi:MAG: HD domain-containing protein [Oscillochloris sp.]|nr:HD domain-containing protein [Oscillochloris sp.]
MDSQITALYELQSRLLSLKLLPRTGWLQRGMRDVESIAEHTFGVATLAMLVGDQQPDIDRGRLLAIALLHDIAEALIGDLPATARRLFGVAAKREAERRAMIELFAGLPQAAEYLELWDEYCTGGSREARLVKALDHLEMLAQALAYERAGSRALSEFWEGEGMQGEEFPLVRELTARLYSERDKLLGAVGRL